MHPVVSLDGVAVGFGGRRRERIIVDHISHLVPCQKRRQRVRAAHVVKAQVAVDRPLILRELRQRTVQPGHDLLLLRVQWGPAPQLGVDPVAVPAFIRQQRAFLFHAQLRACFHRLGLLRRRDTFAVGSMIPLAPPAVNGRLRQRQPQRLVLCRSLDGIHLGIVHAAIAVQPADRRTDAAEDETGKRPAGPLAHHLLRVKLSLGVPCRHVGGIVGQIGADLLRPLDPRLFQEVRQPSLSAGAHHFQKAPQADLLTQSLDGAGDRPPGKCLSRCRSLVRELLRPAPRRLDGHDDQRKRRVDGRQRHE